MEETEVIIVGAGPAGLVLALSLAKFRIKSLVIEKEVEITQDPRGVYLTHDAVRILWDLGLGEDMAWMGQEVPLVNFHKTSFAQMPFHVFDSSSDEYWHCVPNGIFQIQPRLEFLLRKKVTDSPHCILRCGCTVVAREETPSCNIVQYTDTSGSSHQVKGSWLIGADGKTGIVRKHFLEASAGIQQVDSAYKYNGTWVAANLKLTLPTPETHPNFPLWDLGYTPEAIYDLYWPSGWHFCSPPGKPTAAGRFGPHEVRLWRHEFAQNDWHESMDAESLLWEHLLPMVTRGGNDDHQRFPCGRVTYPRDCIEIRRCRPFRFTHKMVNKWYANRTILIGDAAHVFPPFGGQGIASGLRDAHQLAWRLMLLQRLPRVDRALCDDMLQAWSRERVQSILDAASFTKLNGHLCNQGGTWAIWVYRHLDWVIRMIPFIPNLPNPLALVENRGFKYVQEGFFSPEAQGGGRMAQIYMSSKDQPAFLSDSLLREHGAAMTLLVFASQRHDNILAEVKRCVEVLDLNPSIISEASIKMISTAHFPGEDDDFEALTPVPTEQLKHVGVEVKPGYDPMNYLARLGTNPKFAVVRADFYIFGLARDFTELVHCLRQLKRRLDVPIGPTD
ncbi:monooxygenase-like protein [Xylariomycetidae sp. FL0641]|nr:monooxygenase-like protein [Xylariomycetidae sp. FL0641]